MAITAHRLCTPVRDTLNQGASRRRRRPAQGSQRQEWRRNAVLAAMAERDTGSWTSSRARTAALGRWWPALLVLALGWVAWVNAPGACSLEESAWRQADELLTRMMIRTHRPARAAAPSTAVPEQHVPQSAEASAELLRAKRELESALGELRMCRQGAARAQ